MPFVRMPLAPLPTVACLCVAMLADAGCKTTLKFRLAMRIGGPPQKPAISWAARPPECAAVKKLNLVHRGKCRGFFVNFFAAIFPGN